MMKNRPMVLCVLLITCLAAATAIAGDAEKEAVKAAEMWLELIDGGEYGDSWAQSAELFRNAVTKEKWQQSLEAIRKPLGDVVSREVQGTHYTTSAPGAPDGEYVVIQFTTVFEHKKKAVETVTPMKDPDGAWRVSGYYIK